MKLVVKARLSKLAKAFDRTQLAVEKRQVTRGGKTFEQGFHVKGDETPAAKPKPFAGESIFTKRPMPQHTLTTQDYKFLGNVAKLMGMNIPTREAQTADTIAAMKKRLDEGISRGWKLKFGDINTMSANLGKIVDRMSKQGGKGIVMKASEYLHRFKRYNPKLKRRTKLVNRRGRMVLQTVLTSKDHADPQAPGVAKSLVSDVMSAEKAKYGKPKKARVHKGTPKAEKPCMTKVYKASQYTHPEQHVVHGKTKTYTQTKHVGRKPQTEMVTDYWKRREEKYLKRSAASKKAYATVQRHNAGNYSDLPARWGLKPAPVEEYRGGFRPSGTRLMPVRTREEAERSALAGAIHDLVKVAMRSVREMDYNLSKDYEHRNLQAAKYNALAKKMPGLPITAVEYSKIMGKGGGDFDSTRTGLDEEDDITDAIVRKIMPKGKGK